MCHTEMVYIKEVLLMYWTVLDGTGVYTGMADR